MHFYIIMTILFYFFTSFQMSYIFSLDFEMMQAKVNNTSTVLFFYFSNIYFIRVSYFGKIFTSLH